MIDLNKFYEQYQENPGKAKFELVSEATRELFDMIQKDYYEFQDLKTLNYSEMCDRLGWPDFQDGGLFEQAINIATNTVLQIIGYKPLH